MKPTVDLSAVLAALTAREEHGPFRIVDRHLPSLPCWVWSYGFDDSQQGMAWRKRTAPMTHDRATHWHAWQDTKPIVKPTMDKPA